MCGTPSSSRRELVPSPGAATVSPDGSSSVDRLPLCSRHGRAVRCVLERGEDMLITGGRHPYLGKYKVSRRRAGTDRLYVTEMTLRAGSRRRWAALSWELTLSKSANPASLPFCSLCSPATGRLTPALREHVRLWRSTNWIWLIQSE